MRDMIEIQFTSGRVLQVEDNGWSDLIEALAKGPAVVYEGDDLREMMIFPAHVESISWVRRDEDEPAAD